MSEATTDLVIRPLSDLATLAPTPEFLTQYEVLNPAAQAELFAELEEDGIELHLGHLTRVKVPTGGITQFQIEDEDGIEQAVRELIGVILHTLNRRSYWASKLGEGDGVEGPPDCSSRDAKVGEGLYGVGSELNPTGDCGICPMAARGSANTGTQASACKQQKLVFLASPQERLPMVVAVPPASLGGFTSFKVKGAIKRRSRSSGPKEMRLTLKKAKNAKGIEYAEIEFKATERVFTDDEVTIISVFKQRMAQMISENQAALDAMAAAAAKVSTGGAVDDAGVPYDEEPGDDSGLPADEVITPAARR